MLSVFPGSIKKALCILTFAICAIVAISILTNKTRAAELITNGSFETSDFTGWTATNCANPFLTWQVSGAGAGGGFTPGPVATSPVHGTRVAWHGVACNAGSSSVIYQQFTIPAATTAQLRWRDRFQDDHTTFCGGGGEPACGSVTYRVDIVNTSNVVLQNLQTITAPANSFTDTGWRIQVRSLNAFAGQTIRVRFMTTPTVTWDGPGQLEIDAVSVQAPAITTSANVSVGGRVMRADGMGIAKTTVTITDSSGIARSVLTNPFGYYLFEEIAAGEAYTVSVSSKGNTFASPSRIVSVSDTLSDVDFIANPSM